LTTTSLSKRRDDLEAVDASLHFAELARLAELAASYWQSIALAADRNEGGTVSVHLRRKAAVNALRKPNGAEYPRKSPRGLRVAHGSASPDDSPPWLDQRIKDHRGRVIPNEANVLVALRGDNELADLVGYDEMLRAMVVKRSIGLSAIAEGAFPRPLNDADEGRLQEWLQHRECQPSDLTMFIGRSRFGPESVPSTRCGNTSMVWNGMVRTDSTVGCRTI
jgi:hypothetical protein